MIDDSGNNYYWNAVTEVIGIVGLIDTMKTKIFIMKTLLLVQVHGSVPLNL